MLRLSVPPSISSPIYRGKSPFSRKGNWGEGWLQDKSTREWLPQQPCPLSMFWRDGQGHPIHRLPSQTGPPNPTGRALCQEEAERVTVGSFPMLLVLVLFVLHFQVPRQWNPAKFTLRIIFIESEQRSDIEEQKKCRAGKKCLPSMWQTQVLSLAPHLVPQYN